MPKQLIFLVHGMGTHPDGWSKPYQEILANEYSDYPKTFEGDAFSSNFEFKEICYDKFFIEYLKAVKKQADQITKYANLLPNLPTPYLNQLVKLAKMPPDDSFFTTHLCDVILYLTTDIGEVVKNYIMEEITGALGGNNNANQYDGWSIIAHSLGTKVVTDALNAHYSKYPTGGAIGKASAVVMIANVSYLLQEPNAVVGGKGDVYQNEVYPAAKSSRGCCRYYLNAAHDLDPFTFIKKFSPPADFGGNAIPDGNYLHIQMQARDITDQNLNPHELANYLRYPPLHQAIFRYLDTTPGTLRYDETELQTNLNEYHAMLVTNLAKQQALEKLQESSFRNLDQIMGLLDGFGRITSEG